MGLLDKKTVDEKEHCVIDYSSEHLIIVKTLVQNKENNSQKAYDTINELIGQGWQLTSSHIDHMRSTMTPYLQEVYVLTKS
jgi:hypothetical protein